MWFNIDTRGHKKAQKSQNIPVGPEEPPWVITRIQNPGWQKVKFDLSVVIKNKLGLSFVKFSAA